MKDASCRRPSIARALARASIAYAVAVLGISCGAAGAAQSTEAVEAERALRGAIDLHVHSIPDGEPWRIDALDVARLARARGMRGLVLKSHWEPTATVAYLVRKEVPGLEVFGGINLSSAVGGINVKAVEEMARVTGGWGRVVWMPTLEAEAGARARNRPFVGITQNGELLPAVKEVIAAIAKHRLVLATGHSAPEESLLLLREAKRQAVEHMVVTHAMSGGVRMSVPQMQEAAKLGAFVEVVYVHSLTIPELGRKAAFTMAEVANAIRQVGSQSMVLSTDMGQVGIPLPPDGLAAFAVALRKEGISEREIDRMMKENPARLLGLPVE